MTRDTEEQPTSEGATPELDAFIATSTDDETLALGLDTLRAALQQARDAHLHGWAERIYEYVQALEDGRGLNRPL